VQRLRLPHRRALIAAASIAAAGAGAGGLAAAEHGGSGVPSFSRDVQPIFDAKCVACHPVAYPYLDLRRGHSYAQLYRVSAATRPAFERVVPGRPDLSYLLTHPPDPSLRGLLTADDRRTIARWIAGGARND
jgi:hypothetical protein